jgi:hypothetical protein
MLSLPHICPHCGARTVDLDAHFRDTGNLDVCPPGSCRVLFNSRRGVAARLIPDSALLRIAASRVTPAALVPTVGVDAVLATAGDEAAPDRNWPVPTLAASDHSNRFSS